MDAKELRHGNLVYTKHVITCKYSNVRKVSNTIMVNFERENDYLKPIPIAEDRLLEFGFIRDFSHYVGGEFEYSKPDCVIEYSKPDCVIDMDMNLIYICSNDGSVESKGKTPKYVHQLQNLYFAITNKEL